MSMDSNLWSTAVPSRPSTMRELARPCLNDDKDGFKYYDYFVDNDDDLCDY